MLFFTGTSVKNNILSELIVEIVQRLLNCGFFIKAVICDQGANNVSALKLLKVTKDKPFFEVDGRKVYSIFDTPHLFKNVRNHFIKSNFKFQNEEVSFQDVRNVYNIDKISTTSRSLLKITENHINPGPFQMMSCKLAMQLFSNTMAATIKTCVYTGELKSKTALHTAKMIKFLNDLLDVLNSKSLYNSNPFKCAISDTRPQQLQFLEKARSTFETLEKMDVKNKKSKITRHLCFDGMCLTINAIIMLYNEQKEIGFNYILTGRLNSDVIENTFSVFRQRGGYNRNPTARIFRTTFRLNAKMSLMKPSSSSNCEPDDDIHLMTNKDNETRLLDMDSSFSSSSSISMLSIDNSLEEQEAVVNLENCSNTYFAGYLAMKCLLKFSCSNCEKLMIKSGTIPNQLEYLIFCRNYDSKTSNYI